MQCINGITPRATKNKIPIRPLLLGLLALSLLRAPVALGHETKPPVLVVLSYHVGMPWADAIIQGLQDRLSQDAEIVIAQLDVKRFPPAGRESEMLAELTAKASMCKPRLIIAVDDYAYQFILDRRDSFVPGIPVVFGGVNFWAGNQPPDVTGVVENIALSSTLQLMARLQPQARRWVIVNDCSETGIANRKALEHALQQFNSQELLWLGDGTFAETENQLANLDPTHDAVLLLSWNLDKNGTTRSYEKAIAHAICPAPIYGVWGFYFGKGIIGGYLLNGQTHGQEIGDLAQRILKGEKTNDLPVATLCRTTLMVDYRQLERFKIDPHALPPEANIQYKTHKPWEEYIGGLFAIAIVITLQGATITWLIIVRLRRKQAQARLHESEANLRLTLDSIDEAVIVTDPQTKIIRLNPAAETLLGVSPANACGQTLASVLPLRESPTAAPFVLPTLQALIQDRHKTHPIQAFLKTPANAEYTVIYSAVPMLDEAGAARGIVIVVRDVTAQRRLEAQLYQAQKMESIGQFAGGIAHDFNNILAVIIGNGELLNEQLKTQPAALEDLQMMMRGAQRATDLVQQILAFSRKTKHERTPTPLQIVAKEALRFLRSTVPSSIEVAPRISNDLPLILADATQIHQVIMNLCANAIQAMQGTQGRLEIQLETIHVDTEFALAHTGLREGAYVRLSISDTGHGIDQNTLKHIFEPFFTTKKKGEGTGLGLAVVHGIVQSHDGCVFVSSRLGEGTVFHVYLPALSNTEPSSPPPSTAIPSGQGERILLIDDEPAICAAARRVAESLGYRITTFTNPLLALEHLRSHAAEYALLVTDQTMPGATGLELAATVHRLHPELPIVLTTGFAADLTELSIKPIGIGKLLLKPFTTTTLAQTFDAILKPTRPSPPA